MYTTKPLSLFKSHPEAASSPPQPEGPICSGYLILKEQDDDVQHGETGCWGVRRETPVLELPFPQNRVLTVRYVQDYGDGGVTYAQDVVFVPVPGQPPASNRYYAVIATGKHKGLVEACSHEEDMATRCFFRCIKDVKPRPFDPADVYQQMEIVQKRPGLFTARAVAPDGFPCFLFRRKYWHVYESKVKINLGLGEARGLDAELRSSFLDAVPVTTTIAVVGRWYCPFYLIREDGVAPPEQMDRSVFYEVVLEQRWEQMEKVATKRKRAWIGGSVEAEQEVETSWHGDGYVYFRTPEGQRLRVCMCLWMRMRFVELRSGWVDEEGDARKVSGVSVLVESFVLKRMNGSVAAAFDFFHLNKIRTEET